MPIAKEFTIRQEDRPGTFGKVCQALADQNVNILGYQWFPFDHQGDFAPGAKAALQNGFDQRSQSRFLRMLRRLRRAPCLTTSTYVWPAVRNSQSF